MTVDGSGHDDFRPRAAITARSRDYSGRYGATAYIATTPSPSTTSFIPSSYTALTLRFHYIDNSIAIFTGERA